MSVCTPRTAVRVKTTERVTVAWPITGVPAGATVTAQIDAEAPITPTWASGVLSITVAGPDVAASGAVVLTRGLHAVEAIVTTTDGQVIRPSLDPIEVL